MKYSRLILWIFLPWFILSCSPQKEERVKIELPSTPLYKESNLWGVVNTPYLRVYTGRSEKKPITLTLRQGDIVKILATQIVYVKSKRSLWYNIEWQEKSGWVKKKWIDGYESQAKAKTASSLLQF